MARKSIADMIPDMDEPPAPDAAPTAPPDPERKRRAPRRRPERSGAERSAPERPERNDPRPSARDLAAPARRAVVRQALKADVPADLGLLDRMHRYRLDHGVDIRDQVAIAVDEWLTAEGY